MYLDNHEGQTYSFGSATIVQTMNELVEMLTGRGVDITDGAQLKKGFEDLFHIEYYNLPDLGARNYILASNHVSDFDALILGLLGKNIVIMSKNDWVDNAGLMGFLSLNYQLVGVDRSSKSNQARTLVDLIKYLSGPPPARHVLIFPQGTISDINKNSLDRIQAGIFTMSNKANVPVLPIYIEQPNYNHPTRIVFGEPMAIPERKQDCRAEWRDAVIALQNSLDPPARTPILTEKHANNNKPGDPFF